MENDLGLILTGGFVDSSIETEIAGEIGAWTD